MTTTGGTANKVAKFSGASTIVNSIIYDNGSEVGIGTTAPSATLTIDGTLSVIGTTSQNGILIFPAVGAATASTAYDSQVLKMYASAYNSSSKTVVGPHFEWQAEPTNNDTASPGGTLNLLASSYSSGATETGLHINTNGTIHFAPNQTFPGADITGTVNASSYDLGGSLFAAGSASTESAYLGMAREHRSTGVENTGIGYLALAPTPPGPTTRRLGYWRCPTTPPGATTPRPDWWRSTGTQQDNPTRQTALPR